MAEIVYREESYQIMGACFEVYMRMGCGFLEPVYQECLAIALEQQGIPFEREKVIELFYRDQRLAQNYRADFVCYDKILWSLRRSAGWRMNIGRRC